MTRAGAPALGRAIAAALLLAAFVLVPFPATPAIDLVQARTGTGVPGSISIPAGNFEVLAPEELEGPARRIAGMIPGLAKRIGDELGLEIPARGRVIVMASDDPGRPYGDRARAMPRWAAGQSLGGAGVILLRLDRIGSYGQREVGSVLAHELAHMFVSAALPGRGSELPVWFREGTSSVVAREGEIRDYWHLWTSRLPSSSHPFAELEAGFTRGERRQDAYAGALAAVRFLRREYGDGIVPVVLDEARKGVPFREGFRRATGVSLESAARAWLEDLRGPRRWVIWIGSAVTLWIAASILILIAWFVKKRRTRGKLDRWAMEETIAETAREGRLIRPDDDKVH